LDRTYLGNITHDDELELVSVFPKDFLEVRSFRFRPDGGSDGVPFLEEEVDDVDSGETVRAGDEDFASWSDDWHIPLLLKVEWIRGELREV
jgi:hypothetical protein